MPRILQRTSPSTIEQLIPNPRAHVLPVGATAMLQISPAVDA
jgi:hypothetical protein